MTWMKLDDRILEHPKFIRAVRIGGSEALHLWLGLRAWCAQALSDGLVPEDMIDEVRGPRKGRDRALDALLTVGLVERSESGWTLHDYLEWSDSREEVLAARKKAAERQKVSRHRRNCESQNTGQRESRGMSRSDTGVTSSVSHTSVTPSVTRPPRARTETDTETETEDPPVAPQGGAEHESDPWGITPPEQPDQSRAKPEPIAAIARRVFEAWKLDTGHAKAVLDAKRQRRIEARLREGFTEQDLLDALEGRHSDPWLMGTDPKSPRLFDEIDTIYRDAAQVEKLRDLRRNPPSAPTRSAEPRGLAALRTLTIED